MPIDLVQGDSEETVFDFPEVYDAEFDTVYITINMDPIDHFAEWDPV